MNSFYGGPAGQSFEIAEIFNNKFAMEADLQQRWQSPIGVGSFVIISYGLPGDEGYDDNKSLDKEKYGKTYNASLWQKIYEENPIEETMFVSSDYGLGYKLITSITGNTPQFTVVEDVIEANKKPSVTISGDADNSQLTFHLPHSYEFLKGEIEVASLDVNAPPQVSLNPVSQDDPYNLKFSFSIPKSQVIEKVKLDPVKDANEAPTVRIVTDSTEDPEASINNPILYFAFPRVARFDTSLQGTLDPGATPEVDLIQDDPNNLVFSFSLPTSQKMKEPLAETIAPMNPPRVQDIGSVREPQLRFSLPRAVKFYYGSLLGKKSQSTYTLTDEEVLSYAAGDYYINAATGFIYRVTEVTTTQATFEYVACLQAPLPQIETEWLSPFAADGSKNKASVEQLYADAAEQTGQKLIFKFPVLPNFTLDSQFIGAAETSSANLSALDADTMQFVLRIAQGSRIYSTNETSEVMHIEGSKIGDVCLNSETGQVYEQIAIDTWTLKTGVLKGPVGSSLRVVKQFTFTSDEVQDKLADVAVLIESRYKVPESDEIVAVNYQELNPDKTVASETAYWYFYVKEHSYDTTGEWGRAQLTGGVANLIENDRVPEGDTNKAYSVSYINSLIGGLEEADENTTFSKAQVLQMMSWGKFSDLT